MKKICCTWPANMAEKYYEHYTGLAWGKADGYDLCLDCGEIDLPQAVELLAQRYEAMR